MKPDAVIPVTISDSPASDAELSALASLMVAHYVRTHIDEDSCAQTSSEEHATEIVADRELLGAGFQ
jgi:hypothetical protein